MARTRSALLTLLLGCSGSGESAIGPSANDGWFGECESCAECVEDWDCDGGTCTGGFCEAPQCGDGLCEPDEDCSADCQPPDGVCGDGICSLGEFCAMDCQLTCPTIPVGITPLGPPPFSCLEVSPLTAQVVGDINEFWGSAVVPCQCGADTPIGPGCPNNAFAKKQEPGLGYVWFDPNLLQLITDASGGALLGGAWLLAHEVGHNLQAVFGFYPAFDIEAELWSDCMAGYFVGWLVCKGEVSQADMQSVMTAACLIPDTAPWFAPNAHGSCEQRGQAVSVGLNGYLGGLPPQAACAN